MLLTELWCFVSDVLWVAEGSSGLPLLQWLLDPVGENEVVNE